MRDVVFFGFFFLWIILGIVDFFAGTDYSYLIIGNIILIIIIYYFFKVAIAGYRGDTLFEINLYGFKGAALNTGAYVLVLIILLIILNSLQL